MFPQTIAHTSTLTHVELSSTCSLCIYGCVQFTSTSTISVTPCAVFVWRYAVNVALAVRRHRHRLSVVETHNNASEENKRQKRNETREKKTSTTPSMNESVVSGKQFLFYFVFFFKKDARHSRKTPIKTTDRIRSPTSSFSSSVSRLLLSLTVDDAGVPFFRRKQKNRFCHTNLCSMFMASHTNHMNESFSVLKSALSQWTEWKGNWFCIFYVLLISSFITNCEMWKFVTNFRLLHVQRQKNRKWWDEKMLEESYFDETNCKLN